MTQVFEYYNTVFLSLKQMEAELSSAYKQLNNAQSEYSNAASLATQNLNEVLETIEKNTSKVKAFIDIARTHTNQLNEASEPQVYDSGLLSRLSVQINTSMADDPFATQLYTAATGQMMYLKKQKDVVISDNSRQLSDLKLTLSTAQVHAEALIKQIEASIKQYLYSAEFDAFISELQNDYSVFGGQTAYSVLPSSKNGIISIGSLEMPFPVPTGMESAFIETTKGLYDASKRNISIPASISINRGAVLTAEYENSTELDVLNGVQNIILNIARHYGQDFAQITYIDPIRFNASSLGCLSRLVGHQNSLIDAVPSSIEDVRKKMKSIITEINIREARSEHLSIQSKKKALYVFHDFPQAYDANLVMQIQQLCVNAEHYGIMVVLTHNKSSKNYTSADVLQYIRTISTNIIVQKNGFEIKIADEPTPCCFKWYKAPSTLPNDLEKTYIEGRPILDLSNDYNKRIGFTGTPTYQKGYRALEKIPYGIDENGNLQYLDFENSNFATFICGAARSGKSTLLHTLISGLIKNNHPDDIEIWLIDFKMTEFSRYISHLPPHVRYIILDESPELVYDIIDRLTEILVKRQNMFKGKWLKLSDVPTEKYMPSIMVIIDEFSVMSQIIADSIASSNENYSVKLQMLLAKGAALGLHFIFASQGFTSGTRGLNDFSKKQIQQRIAMKTEYNEIKETLDIKSASDEDTALMEQLPVHHALTRIPADEHGNHLKLSQVIYISDYTEQEDMIDRISESFTPVSKYDVTNANGYICKRPMVVDGNLYLAFAAKVEEIKSYLESHRDLYEFNDEYTLFVGEPRRMMSLYPLAIANEFCENILLLSTSNEKMAASSVLLSIARSLEIQGMQMELWSTKKNPIYRQIKTDCHDPMQTISDFDQICETIRELKAKIQSKIENNKFFILLGFETLLTDMSYQAGDGSGFSSNDLRTSVTYEKRGKDEPDLNSLLDALSRGETLGISSQSPVAEVSVSNTSKGAYDARDDLKFILANGPRLGYHFIMCFGTTGDFQQSKIDISVFKHKLIFRTAKADAMSIVGSGNATVVSELEDHSFRYSNGLDSLSFRPYLHKGLSWDGWQLAGGTVVNTVDEEEEYLL